MALVSTELVPEKKSIMIFLQIVRNLTYLSRRQTSWMNRIAKQPSTLKNAMIRKSNRISIIANCNVPEQRDAIRQPPIRAHCLFCTSTIIIIIFFKKNSITTNHRLHASDCARKAHRYRPTAPILNQLRYFSITRFNQDHLSVLSMQAVYQDTDSNQTEHEWRNQYVKFELSLTCGTQRRIESYVSNALVFVSNTKY